MANSNVQHVHQERFDRVSPERLFAILHTPSAIRAWWGAAHVLVIPQTGGIWCAAWGDDEDHPDYVSSARMQLFDPPRRMVLADQSYLDHGQPLPFQVDFMTMFEVEPHIDENGNATGGSTLRVTQHGFPGTPEAQAFRAACEQGWRDTFAGIRRYLEST